MATRHYYVRLRRYIRHKKDIKNTLYRRFTLSNRGYTPISFKTRNLNFKFTYTKRLYFYRNIYSRRSGRIYHINGKDWRFDFSSCMPPKEIISLSKSLDPTNVCAMYMLQNGKFVYIFPFKETNAQAWPIDTSDFLYPGLYYSRGLWMWTDQVSDNLNSLVCRVVIPDDSHFTTDYTCGNISILDKNTLLNSCKYFIYVPFDSIKTTVLQAYLPMCKSQVLLEDLYRGGSSDKVDFLPCTIFWMGKPLQLFGWKEEGYTNRIYMNRTLRTGEGFSRTLDKADALANTIYYNSIPIDSQFHHLSRVSFL